MCIYILIIIIRGSNYNIFDYILSMYFLRYFKQNFRFLNKLICKIHHSTRSICTSLIRNIPSIFFALHLIPLQLPNLFCIITTTIVIIILIFQQVMHERPQNTFSSKVHFMKNYTYDISDNKGSICMLFLVRSIAPKLLKNKNIYINKSNNNVANVL